MTMQNGSQANNCWVDSYRLLNKTMETAPTIQTIGTSFTTMLHTPLQSCALCLVVSQRHFFFRFYFLSLSFSITALGFFAYL